MSEARRQQINDSIIENVIKNPLSDGAWQQLLGLVRGYGAAEQREFLASNLAANHQRIFNLMKDHLTPAHYGCQMLYYLLISPSDRLENLLGQTPVVGVVLEILHLYPSNEYPSDFLDSVEYNALLALNKISTNYQSFMINFPAGQANVTLQQAILHLLRRNVLYEQQPEFVQKICLIVLRRLVELMAPDERRIFGENYRQVVENVANHFTNRRVADDILNLIQPSQEPVNNM